ncbi:MAG: DegV family protein [Candidatus Nanoarchaeia archaeon]|nr:DegV family protein [Candidatus Nanoarchaeia archaeon]
MEDDYYKKSVGDYSKVKEFSKDIIQSFNVSLIVDSTIDFVRESDKEKVTLVNVNTFLNNSEFNGTINELYELLKNKKNEFTTKEAGQQNFEAAINKQSKGNKIIIIAASSKLTEDYNNAVLAAKNNPDISVFDSRLISGSYGLLISKVIDDIESKISYDSIISRIPMHKDRISSYFVVNDIDYLVKGGRISKTMGFLGKIGGIKPVLKLYEGKIISAGKTLHSGALTSGLYTYLNEQISNNSVYIFENNIFNNKKESINLIKNSKHCGKLNPVIAIHIGPQYLAFFWYNE